MFHAELLFLSQYKLFIYFYNELILIICNEFDFMVVLIVFYMGFISCFDLCIILFIKSVREHYQGVSTFIFHFILIFLKGILLFNLDYAIFYFYPKALIIYFLLHHLSLVFQTQIINCIMKIIIEVYLKT